MILQQKVSAYYDSIRKRIRERKLLKIDNSNSFIPKDKISKRTYYTHHRNTIPYKIIINKSKILVTTKNYYETNLHDSSEESSEISHDSQLIEIRDFVGYWKGFDTSIKKSVGTSILVKINNLEYIFIGSEMFYFSTNDVIRDFVNRLDSDDTVYPIAIGSSNMYFLSEKQFVNKDLFKTPLKIAYSGKIYDEFCERFLDREGEILIDLSYL